MKRVIAAALAFVVAMSLTGCSVGQTAETPKETLDPSKEYHDVLKGETTLKSTPVNYMDEIKAEIHYELFREETPETLDIIERIFKHLKVETVTSKVEGDKAQVLMNITTVNAGNAWVVGLEKYAIVCAENLFSDTYVDDATLYEYYLEEFEKSVRKAEYVTIPVVVEMDYKNHRWIWDIDDDVINAITGYLLAAIEGELNSSNIIIPEVEDVRPPVETGSEKIELEQNNTSPVSIIGYDLSTDADGKKCLVVKYKWINTSNETESYWIDFSDRAFQNGIELDTSYPSSKNHYYELYSNWAREIRPGTSIEFVRFFILRDPSIVSGIEIESYDAWTNTIYTSGTTAF